MTDQENQESAFTTLFRCKVAISKFKVFANNIYDTTRQENKSNILGDIMRARVQDIKDWSKRIDDGERQSLVYQLFSKIQFAPILNTFPVTIPMTERQFLLSTTGIVDAHGLNRQIKFGEDVIGKCRNLYESEISVKQKCIEELITKYYPNASSYLQESRTIAMRVLPLRNIYGSNQNLLQEMLKFDSAKAQCIEHFKQLQTLIDDIIKISIMMIEIVDISPNKNDKISYNQRNDFLQAYALKTEDSPSAALNELQRNMKMHIQFVNFLYAAQQCILDGVPTSSQTPDVTIEENLLKSVLSSDLIKLDPRFSSYAGDHFQNGRSRLTLTQAVIRVTSQILKNRQKLFLFVCQKSSRSEFFPDEKFFTSIFADAQGVGITASLSEFISGKQLSEEEKMRCNQICTEAAKLTNLTGIVKCDDMCSGDNRTEDYSCLREKYEQAESRVINEPGTLEEKQNMKIKEVIRKLLSYPKVSDPTQCRPNLLNQTAKNISQQICEKRFDLACGSNGADCDAQNMKQIICNPQKSHYENFSIPENEQIELNPSAIRVSETARFTQRAKEAKIRDQSCLGALKGCKQGLSACIEDLASDRPQYLSQETLEKCKPIVTFLESKNKDLSDANKIKSTRKIVSTIASSPNLDTTVNTLDGSSSKGEWAELNDQFETSPIFKLIEILQNPQKTDKGVQFQNIATDYYRQVCDMVLEFERGDSNTQLQSMSHLENKRATFELNLQVFEQGILKNVEIVIRELESSQQNALVIGLGYLIRGSLKLDEYTARSNRELCKHTIFESIINAAAIQDSQDDLSVARNMPGLVVGATMGRILFECSKDSRNNLSLYHSFIEASNVRTLNPSDYLYDKLFMHLEWFENLCEIRNVDSLDGLKASDKFYEEFENMWKATENPTEVKLNEVKNIYKKLKEFGPFENHIAPVALLYSSIMNLRFFKRDEWKPICQSASGLLITLQLINDYNTSSDSEKEALIVNARERASEVLESSDQFKRDLELFTTRVKRDQVTPVMSHGDYLQCERLDGYANQILGSVLQLQQKFEQEAKSDFTAKELNEAERQEAKNEKWKTFLGTFLGGAIALTAVTYFGGITGILGGALSASGSLAKFVVSTTIGMPSFGPISAQQQVDKEGKSTGSIASPLGVSGALLHHLSKGASSFAWLASTAITTGTAIAATGIQRRIQNWTSATINHAFSFIFSGEPEVQKQREVMAAKFKDIVPLNPESMEDHRLGRWGRNIQTIAAQISATISGDDPALGQSQLAYLAAQLRTQGKAHASMFHSLDMDFNIVVDFWTVVVTDPQEQLALTDKTRADTETLSDTFVAKMLTEHEELKRYAGLYIMHLAASCGDAYTDDARLEHICKPLQCGLNNDQNNSIYLPQFKPNEFVRFLNLFHMVQIVNGAYFYEHDSELKSHIKDQKVASTRGISIRSRSSIVTENTGVENLKVRMTSQEHPEYLCRVINKQGIRLPSARSGADANSQIQHHIKTCWELLYLTVLLRRFGIIYKQTLSKGEEFADTRTRHHLEALFIAHKNNGKLKPDVLYPRGKSRNLDKEFVRNDLEGSQMSHLPIHEDYHYYDIDYTRLSKSGKMISHRYKNYISEAPKSHNKLVTFSFEDAIKKISSII